MPWGEFCFRLVLALILGCVIGFERQWRQRTAGMLTNLLVSIGSALFVLMGMMTQGESSHNRIAAQVASVIGFLVARDLRPRPWWELSPSWPPIFYCGLLPRDSSGLRPIPRKGGQIIG